MRTAHWIACSLMVALMLAAGCTYSHSQRQAKSEKDAKAMTNMPSANQLVPSLRMVPMSAYWGA